MSQKTLTVEVVTIKPFKDNMFEEFFGIDLDFVENEEYFGDNTLELGYESEAQRLSQEFSIRFKRDWVKAGVKGEDDDEFFMKLLGEYLEEASNVYMSDSQFILGNSNYTDHYVITPIFNGDSIDYDADITVVISYMG